MRIAAVAAACALAVALAGCGGGPPTQSPSATPAPSPSPSTPASSPSPSAASMSIPVCETLLPIADARAVFSDSTEFLGELPAADFESRFPVPEVRATLASVDPALHCLWGVPNSDGSFAVGVGSITDADRAALESALAGAGFTSATMGTVTGYEGEGDGEVSSIAEVHLFTGELWIAVAGNSLASTGVVAATVLEAMRTANPTLGL